MEQTLTEVENKIKECESRIAMYKRQLQDHEEGVRRLSPMVKTSSETKLETTEELLERYKIKQKELLNLDAQILVQKEQELIKARKKAYFDNQERRIKRSRDYRKNVKIEVLNTMSELPSEALFEDEELFDMAVMSLKYHIRDQVDIYERLSEIKKELKLMLKEIDVSVIDDHKVMVEHIPYIILFLWILTENIKNIKEKEKGKKFNGFPKYQDWWINELWTSHQAYYSLYKWREIIFNLCETNIQRKIWEISFVQWLNIKRNLNRKGAKAYSLTLIFDKLILKYSTFEEEIDDKNISNLQTIMKRVASKENFATIKEGHSVMTPYLRFKLNR